MAEAAMMVAMGNISSDGSNKGGNSDSNGGCLDGSSINGDRGVRSDGGGDNG